MDAVERYLREQIAGLDREIAALQRQIDRAKTLRERHVDDLKHHGVDLPKPAA